MVETAAALPRLIAILALLAAIGAAGLLYFGGTPAPPAAAQTTTDYDTDGDGLIEISNLDQLNAIRHDLDGDGVPTSTAGVAAYGAAFTNRDTNAATRMGCPSGNCAGYELMANLTFPAATSSAYNPWTPIGTAAAPYNSTLEGNGRALTNLRVNFAGQAGLFGELGRSSRTRNLELVNPSVTSTSAGAGALAALVQGTASVNGRAVVRFRQRALGGAASGFPLSRE